MPGLSPFSAAYYHVAYRPGDKILRQKVLVFLEDNESFDFDYDSQVLESVDVV